MEIDLFNQPDEQCQNGPRELLLYFEGKGEVRGHSFRQIKRSDRAYIYEVSDSSGKKWYEVFARKEHSRFAIIAYPKASAFGVWAWAPNLLRKANMYFDRLNGK